MFKLINQIKMKTSYLLTLILLFNGIICYSQNDQENLKQVISDKTKSSPGEDSYNIYNDWISVNSFPDMSDFSLGSSFKSKDLTIIFKNNLIIVDSIVESTTHSSDVFKAYLVSSSRGLRKALQIDAKIEVSYFNMSAENTFSMYKNFELNTQSLALVIQHTRVDKTLELIPKELSKEGLFKAPRNLIRSKDYPKFYSRYGDRYIKKLDQGYVLYTILRIDNVSQSNYQSIDNKFKFDYDGLVDVSAEASVKQLLDEHFKESKISISVSSLGTNQRLRDSLSTILQGVYDATKSSTDLLRKISDIYKTDSINNKVYNLKFWAASLEDFDWKHPKDYQEIPDKSYLRMQRIIDNYAYARRKIFTIEEIWKDRSSISPRLSKSLKDSLYNITRNNWLDYVEKLSDIFAQCKTNPKCDSCCKAPKILFGNEYELPKMYAIQLTPDNHYLAGNLGDNDPIAGAYQSLAQTVHGLPQWHVYVMSSFANILVDPNIEHINLDYSQMLKMKDDVIATLKRNNWSAQELNNVKLIDLGEYYPNLNISGRKLGRDWIKFHYYCID